MQNNILWNFCASWNQTLEEWSLGGSWHKLFVLTWQKNGNQRQFLLWLAIIRKNSWETCRIIFLGKLPSHHTFISILSYIYQYICICKLFFVWISKSATTTGLILTWDIYINFFFLNFTVYNNRNFTRMLLSRFFRIRTMLLDSFFYVCTYLCKLDK